MQITPCPRPESPATAASAQVNGKERSHVPAHGKEHDHASANGNMRRCAPAVGWLSVLLGALGRSWAPRSETITMDGIVSKRCASIYVLAVRLASLKPPWLSIFPIRQRLINTEQVKRGVKGASRRSGVELRPGCPDGTDGRHHFSKLL